MSIIFQSFFCFHNEKGHKQPNEKNHESEKSNFVVLFCPVGNNNNNNNNKNNNSHNNNNNNSSSTETASLSSKKVDEKTSPPEVLTGGVRDKAAGFQEKIEHERKKSETVFVKGNSRRSSVDMNTNNNNSLLSLKSPTSKEIEKPDVHVDSNNVSPSEMNSNASTASTDSSSNEVSPTVVVSSPSNINKSLVDDDDVLHNNQVLTVDDDASSSSSSSTPSTSHPGSPSHRYASSTIASIAKSVVSGDKKKSNRKRNQ